MATPISAPGEPRPRLGDLCADDHTGVVMPTAILCNLDLLSAQAYRLFSYILQRTWGFRKRSDEISYPQLMRGIQRRDGSRLDGGAGIGSRGTVAAALKELEAHGLIERTSGSGRDATIVDVAIRHPFGIDLAPGPAGHRRPASSASSASSVPSVPSAPSAPSAPVSRQEFIPSASSAPSTPAAPPVQSVRPSRTPQRAVDAQGSNAQGDVPIHVDKNKSDDGETTRLSVCATQTAGEDASRAQDVQQALEDAGVHRPQAAFLARRVDVDRIAAVIAAVRAREDAGLIRTTTGAYISYLLMHDLPVAPSDMAADTGVLMGATPRLAREESREEPGQEPTQGRPACGPIWTRIKEEWRHDLTRENYTYWVAATGSREQGDEVVVLVADEATRWWFAHRLHKAITRVAGRIGHGTLRITYDIGSEESGTGTGTDMSADVASAA